MQVMEPITVQTVLEALNRITGGRIPASDIPKKAGSHPFVLEKNSGLVGKAVLETPGLVVGDLEKPIASMGIGMTLTESMIELAGAMRLDAILVHHPVADGASAGGVALKPYLELYKLALFELHEAFHGLHPGIAFLHGHTVEKSEHQVGGIPGNIITYGRALPEIRTANDILNRLNAFMDIENERRVHGMETEIRGCSQMQETTLAAMPILLSGTPESQVSHVLHIYPHTGFTACHLEEALVRFPETDTIVASISRVLETSALVAMARAKGLTFIVGNSHALEIFENGLPLASAIAELLPGLPLVMLRERMTATPVRQFGNARMQAYGQEMAAHLINSFAHTNKPR